MNVKNLNMVDGRKIRLSRVPRSYFTIASITYEWNTATDKQYLAEMVKHKLSDPNPPPLRVRENEGDVGLRVRDVGDHEGEGNNDATVDNDTTEVGILKAFGN